MATQNGSMHGVLSGSSLDDQLESFKANVRKWIDRVSTKREGESRVRAFLAKSGELIKDHPIASVGIAFGIGYAVVRIVRR